MPPPVSDSPTVPVRAWSTTMGAMVSFTEVLQVRFETLWFSGLRWVYTPLRRPIVETYGQGRVRIGNGPPRPPGRAPLALSNVALGTREALRDIRAFLERRERDRTLIVWTQFRATRNIGWQTVSGDAKLVWEVERGLGARPEWAEFIGQPSGPADGMGPTVYDQIG